MKKNKGDRPNKPVKRSYRFRVACSALELEITEAAFNSHIASRQKTLPKEVLDFTGQLNHLAANSQSGWPQYECAGAGCPYVL
ncbi:hypothetical protein LL912_02100 [Niabella sp. CC-SYL272]|uniref:hypothetical protein n=1 Tax=Niabella agricola TaxID=2891571 RepID=UPI001F48D7A8|nr:hypothetical protein [Niabella agricola]MCF3107561.1 hypothetical protein [Niabella agricola]